MGRLPCVSTGSSSGSARGALLACEAPRETERERAGGFIYFRLPVPGRGGMIYAERVPRLRAAGEFSLSAPHPAVSPGWRSVPLPVSFSFSLSFPSPSNIAARTAMRLSRMTCNYRPHRSLFFFLRSFAERFRGRRANHRATTEWSELCAPRMNGMRTRGRHSAQFVRSEVREADTPKSEFLLTYAAFDRPNSIIFVHI